MSDHRQGLELKLFGPTTHYEQPTHIEAFIAVQRLVREIGQYSYIEVGSARGASLEPHLIDPKCDSAMSIDLRVVQQWDERGTHFYYAGETTSGMIRDLQKHCTAQELTKLQTVDGSSAEIGKLVREGKRFQIGLIDAEHTNTAVFDDFANLYPAMANDSCILFDDANLVFAAIENAGRALQLLGQPYETIYMRPRNAAILVGNFVKLKSQIAADWIVSRDNFVESARRQLIRSIMLSNCSDEGLWNECDALRRRKAAGK